MFDGIKSRMLLECRFCRKIDSQSVVNEVERCVDFVRDLTQIDVTKNLTKFSEPDLYPVFIFFQMTISPHLPSLACNDCVERLLDATLMREICIESERRLLNLIATRNDGFEVEDTQEPGELNPLLSSKFLHKATLPPGRPNINFQSLTIKPVKVVSAPTKCFTPKKSSVRVIIQNIPDEVTDQNQDIFENIEKKQLCPLDIQEVNKTIKSNVKELLKKKLLSPKPKSIANPDDKTISTRTQTARERYQTRKSLGILPKRISKYSCCQCQFSSTDKLETKEHFEQNHLDKRQSDDGKLSRHSCNLCYQVFKSKIEVYLHKRAPRIKRSICSECEQEFTNVSTLRRHRLEQHGIVEEFPCQQCERVFTNPSSLSNHITFQHNTVMHECEECGAKFKRADSLRDHTKSHKQIFSIQCRICGQRFVRKGGLTSHMKTHTGKRPYKCEYCTKTFSFATDKKRHLVVHTGIYPYTCDKCGRGFLRKKILTTHILKHN